VTALQAQTRFGELLDRLVRDEEIVITRHDEAVALRIPEGGLNLRQVRGRRALGEVAAGPGLRRVESVGLMLPMLDNRWLPKHWGKSLPRRSRAAPRSLPLACS
jgi:antitoxin (DNA-binding transcriptional repressor) of toxin-antitoxin stability system